MGHKIIDIKDELDAIASEITTLHLREIVVETEVHEMERGQTSSLVNESEIYGRNDEKEEIIKLLIDNFSCDDDVSVYAICGTGGLGKTTLAQLVYNDGRIKWHFELRIWVCVSDVFDVERLIRAILESIQGHRCDISNLDPLLHHLQEKLGGRKFLLILDDVWNEYHEKWDGLKQALRCGAKRSTIIVTTRIQKVALIMATILPIRHLAYLSEDDSWSLFKQRAFGNRGREENIQLELIGKDIVKKCGGLPLAIKALGSLMQFKSSESESLSVKESKILDLSDGGNAVLPALRLNYEALPPHLRQCFAYCCIFPKDYTMKKDALIEMWMANGFIPSRGQTTLYDMGHQIFDQLVWRSFLQDVKEEQGETTCKMHDLTHDLAESIMRHECFIMDSRKGLKLPKKVRHLSFNVSSTPMIHCNEVMFKVPSLRSCILLSNQYSCKDNDFSWISKQKYLRLLDLSGKIDEKVAVSISNFKHLRFLNMSYSYIKTLPESISGLQHLQTLKLNYCEEICKLPKRLKHMRNLTCLDIKGCDSLTSMPTNRGQLTCLQRLSIFIVGQDEGYQISELKELNLGGELSIKELENVRNSEDAKRANLKSKLDLISLNLCWSDSNKESIPKNVEEILENL
ncbi:putative disease resistance protein RGA3 [Camellia sinensis]|uniref:putative disease resistance protein RGA3 n=1 Tax=Camellia sinensis TaxID=4442 RepID=UPI00103661FC|nr:putative disease resistance protein RGA3 [Camellia sinensis]